MSEKWPTEPLILIIDGLSSGQPVSNTAALLDGNPEEDVYTLISGDSAGEYLYPDLPGDVISDWVEARVVPEPLLDRLQFLLDNGAAEGVLADAVGKLLKSDPTLMLNSIASVVAVLGRDDRGGKINPENYTGQLLRSMPSNTSYPGYVNLLCMANDALEYIRYMGNPDPLKTLKEEAEAVKLPVESGERFARLTLEIGTFLTDPCAGNASKIGSTAIAWAAALTANI
nr:MAG TPA: hypothetical protein [Caudoviricetes sp.]